MSLKWALPGSLAQHMSSTNKSQPAMLQPAFSIIAYLRFHLITKNFTNLRLVARSNALRSKNFRDCSIYVLPAFPAVIIMAKKSKALVCVLYPSRSAAPRPSNYTHSSNFYFTALCCNILITHIRLFQTCRHEKKDGGHWWQTNKCRYTRKQRVDMARKVKQHLQLVKCF